MSLQDVQNIWKDQSEIHQAINEDFHAKVNATPELKDHRDWVEQHIFGFGERSFHWLHKLIVDEMPEEFSFLEVGVFRAQVLSLYKLLADAQEKKVARYGVTPLDGSDGHWDSDYAKDIKTIHERFNLKPDYKIIHGLSTDPEIIREVEGMQVDVVYIDGGHGLETVRSDLKNFLPLVKPGGYLIVDDCANRFNLPNGYFAGIESVTQAVTEVLPPFVENKEFEFLFNVVHNLIWRKK